MLQQRGTSPRIVSRRSVIQLGVATGLALGSVRLSGVAVSAQGTPEAVETAGDSYARPEMLIDAAELMERVGDPTLTIIAAMPPRSLPRGTSRERCSSPMQTQDHG